MVFENNGRKIKICNNVLDIIKKYIQYDRESCEAGGVLIGRENISDNNLIVEYVTEPMSGDKKSRKRFYRKDNGHIYFYKQMYEENKGIYAYVGEWHTHPEAIPLYSILDFENWKKIGRDSGHNSAHIHLIAGYEALRLWEFSENRKETTDLITIRWNEVTLDEGN